METALLRASGIDAFCPDTTGAYAYSSVIFGAGRWYRVCCPRDQAEAAREILAAYREDKLEPAYACPQTGAPSYRKLGFLKMIVFWVITLGQAPSILGIVPFRRRMRYCFESKLSFLPEPAEPFTTAELGYDPDGPVEGDFVDWFKSKVSRLRSIGYEHVADKEEPRP